VPARPARAPAQPAWASLVSSPRRLWTSAAASLLGLVVLAAGIFVVLYRSTYNVWPGEQASGRVHWCGRDYEDGGSPAQTWRQITAQAPWPIRPEGSYPPLARSPEQLFAAVYPAAERSPYSCAEFVYLRTGPDKYHTYSLLGGP
jgi:hypothetical protein